jgi:hypothetical protein
MPTNFQVQRGFLLSVFIFISILTVISSSIVIISNIITIVIECYYYAVIDIELSNVMIRLYLIIISIGIIFTEMEWTDTIRSITILQSWFFRGLSYNFAGILCYDEKLKFNEKIMSNPNVVADLSHNVIFITNELLILSSTCLMIFGILYAVMVCIYYLIIIIFNDTLYIRELYV